MKPNVNWGYRISERALKQLKKLDKQVAKHLDERITGADNPRRWGKQLKGEMDGIWRYRVGDYRVLCQLQDGICMVLVVDVDHRKDVYG